MAGVGTPEQVHSVADSHLAQTRELASGVDGLYLSGRAALSPDLLARLEDRRALAEGTGVAIPFELGATELGMLPHSWGKYRYALESPEARIGLTVSTQLPTIRVQLRSRHLHTAGPAGAVEDIRKTLQDEMGEVSLWVSRLDLYADLEGWTPDGGGQNRFVCRADTVRTYETDGHLTGFEFGKRATGTICARIYDKTTDLARTGADWWFDIWERDPEASGSVWRVEFEINRKGLDSFGVKGPEETLAAVGDIWAYCAGQWLTHRSPTGDANQARWPLTPGWEQVQGVVLAQHRVGIERVTQRLRCASLRRLTPGLVGYVVGFAVLSDTSGIDDTMVALGRHLREDETARRTPFTERMHRRRIERYFHE